MTARLPTEPEIDVRILSGTDSRHCRPTCLLRVQRGCRSLSSTILRTRELREKIYLAMRKMDSRQADEPNRAEPSAGPKCRDMGHCVVDNVVRWIPYLEQYEHKPR